jgi:hypothetical protein
MRAVSGTRPLDCHRNAEAPTGLGERGHVLLPLVVTIAAPAAISWRY